MTTTKTMSLVAFCLLVCMVALLFETPAQAQSVGLDQDIAERRGIGGSLASGRDEKEDSESVTRFQAMLGIGSVLVAFAVIKFW